MGQTKNDRRSVAELQQELRERDDLIRQLEEELEAVRKGRDVVVAINANLLDELNQEHLPGKRHTGRVKFFLPEGWGFIVPDDGSPEIFVHYRYIRGRGHRELPEGARVAYVKASGERGEYADDVVVVQNGVTV